jgi:hypothetical protein
MILATIARRKKGTFSRIKARRFGAAGTADSAGIEPDFLKLANRFSGQKSRRSRTQGNVTAMGFDINASANKASEAP